MVRRGTGPDPSPLVKTDDPNRTRTVLLLRNRLLEFMWVALVPRLRVQRYRPTGSTFIQVKLSGYLDRTTGFPSIRTSERLSRR